VVASALLVFGILLVLPYSGPDVRWAPDSLFYLAQKRELQGVERSAALREVFAGAGAAELKRGERDLPPPLRRIANPAWQTYSSRFYRRRWTVPVLAAALEPLVGRRSIEDPSLLGWALLAPLLFLLLRRRFETGIAAAVSVFCSVLPPIFFVGPVPSTDLLALSLLVAGVLVAWQVRSRGLRWLPAWVLVVLVLSFTRDADIVLIAAVGWLALRERSRRAVVLLATGVLASLPAPLLFAAPVRDNLAYTFNAYRIPTDSSWGAILGEYPHHLARVVRYDLEYPLDSGAPVIAFVMGVVVIAGLVVLYARSDRDDPFLLLARGAAVGGLVTVLLAVNYSNGRLELVLVPSIATGVAVVGERVAARMRLRSARTPAAPSGG
jgi:hypothetical protein